MPCMGVETYLKLVTERVEIAQKENNGPEVLRLLRVLRDALTEIIEKHGE